MVSSYSLFTYLCSSVSLFLNFTETCGPSSLFSCHANTTCRHHDLLHTSHLYPSWFLLELTSYLPSKSSTSGLLVKVEDFYENDSESWRNFSVILRKGNDVELLKAKIYQWTLQLCLPSSIQRRPEIDLVSSEVIQIIC